MVADAAPRGNPLALGGRASRSCAPCRGRRPLIRDRGGAREGRRRRACVAGYDVWNPLEVQPEYGADFSKGPKKGQLHKVDYALKINGEPIIFVECKAADVALDAHDPQLSGYFNATPAVRAAILTNGVRVKGVPDLQQQNIMDEKPWMDFDIRSAKQAEIDALKKFRKTEFTADQIVGLAEEMVYYNVLVPFIASQLRDPGESLSNWSPTRSRQSNASTRKVVDRLTPIFARPFSRPFSTMWPVPSVRRPNLSRFQASRCNHPWTLQQRCVERPSQGHPGRVARRRRHQGRATPRSPTNNAWMLPGSSRSSWRPMRQNWLGSAVRSNRRPQRTPRRTPRPYPRAPAGDR